MSDGAYERPAIAGSGVIACGLAASASAAGRVQLLARSDASNGDPGEVRVTTAVDDLVDCDLVIEAIIEDLDAKREYLAELGTAAADADLATTTSSLSVSALGDGSGHPERLFGLHVFNPVQKMELVELCLPEGLRSGVGERARAWCQALGKTAVEVPDQAGYVVNRLRHDLSDVVGVSLDKRAVGRTAAFRNPHLRCFLAALRQCRWR